MDYNNNNNLNFDGEDLATELKNDILDASLNIFRGDMKINGTLYVDTEVIHEIEKLETKDAIIELNNKQIIGDPNKDIGLVGKNSNGSTIDYKGCIFQKNTDKLVVFNDAITDPNGNGLQTPYNLGTVCVRDAINSNEVINKGQMDTQLQTKLNVSNNVIDEPLTFKDNTASTGIERNVELLKTSYSNGVQLGVVLDLDNSEIRNVADAQLNSNAPNLGQVKDLLNLKLNLTGGTLSGDLNLGNNKITNVSSPVALGDVANKEYVDEQDSFRVSKQGDSMTGQLNMSNNKITNLANPSDGTDATNKNYVDIAVNSKLSIAGGQLNGDLNMLDNKITNLGNPTNASDAVNKEYVDAIDVNPNVYEYTTFGNDSLVEIDFTSTFSTANPINVKVEYLAVSTDGSPFLLKKIGSYSFRTYTSANFADYRIPDYYIGNAGDDYIGVKWDTTGDPDKLKIYLKSISPTDSIKGRVKITILDEGYQMGEGRIIDLVVRNTVMPVVPNDRLLINKEYVDDKVYSFKSRGIALTTNEVLKIQIPILNLSEAGSRWLPFKVKFSGLNSSEVNTVHFTEAYYHIDVNESGDKLPVHYLGKDQTGLIKVDTDITGSLARYLNVYIRHTVAQNIVTSVEIDFMETSYMTLDINNAVQTEIANGGIDLTFPNVPDEAFIVDKTYVDNAISNINTSSFISTTGGTMTGNLNMNATLQMGTNQIINFTNNNGRIAGIKDTPDFDNDAVNKNYVDTAVASGGGILRNSYLFQGGNSGYNIPNTGLNINPGQMIVQAGSYICTATVNFWTDSLSEQNQTVQVQTAYGNSLTMCSPSVKNLQAGGTEKKSTITTQFKIDILGAVGQNFDTQLRLQCYKESIGNNSVPSTGVEWVVVFQPLTT